MTAGLQVSHMPGSTSNSPGPEVLKTGKSQTQPKSFEEDQDQQGNFLEDHDFGTILSQIKDKIGFDNFFNMNMSESACPGFALSNSDQLVLQLQCSGLGSKGPNLSISKQMIYTLAKEAKRRVDMLHHTTERRKRMMDLRISCLAMHRSLHDRKLISILSQVRMKHLLFERRLRQQNDTATRRLQELLFECTGELHKTQQRTLVVQENSYASAESRLSGKHHVHLWRNFLQRLEGDSLNILKTIDIDPYKKSTLYKSYEEEARLLLAKKKLTDVEVLSVARVSFAQKGRSSSAKPSKNSKNKMKQMTKQHKICIANSNNREEMTELLSTLFVEAGIRFRGASEALDNKSNDDKKSQRDANDFSANGCYSYGRRTLRGTRDLPLLPPVTYLCSTTISWLLWPQFAKSAIDSRIYYCIEERNENILRLGNHNGKTNRNNSVNYSHVAFELARSLADIYVEKEIAIDATPHREILEYIESTIESDTWPLGLPIVRKEGSHRLHADQMIHSTENPDTIRAAELLTTYPDVIIAEYENDNKPSSRFHFAAANTQHLLELSRFEYWARCQLDASQRSKLGKHYVKAIRGILGNLYVAFPKSYNSTAVSDSDLYSNCHMIPLPEDAIDELITIYITRNKQLKNSALSMIGDLDCQCALIKMPTVDNPSIPSNSKAKDAQAKILGVYSDKHTSKKEEKSKADSPQMHSNVLLVCFKNMEPQNMTKQVENIDNDKATHSEYCNWRACNAYAQEDSKLCNYHSIMAGRLQSFPGGSADVKRHMPRATASQLAKLGGTRSTLKQSSLMTELMNEKLSKTIEGFCKRASHACRPRKSRNNRDENDDETSAVTVRLRRANEDIGKCEMELALSRKVLLAESKVVEELNLFSDFGIFPADELAAIREEYKVLDQEREALTKDRESTSGHSSTGSGGRSQKKGYRKNTGSSKRNQMVVSNTFVSSLIGTATTDSENRYLIQDFNQIIGLPDDYDGENNKYVITNDIPLDQRRAETEFELEFCLRKFSILQRERLNIEASMHPANRSPSQRSGALLFDDNGYPMPLNSSTTSKRVPKLPKPVRVRKGTKEQTTTKRGSPYLKAIRK